MANILFIAYDFPPILSPESIQVQRRAVTLANNGHKVFILTSHEEPLFEFIDKNLIQKSQNIKIYRTKKPLFEQFINFIFKILNITDRKFWWQYYALEQSKYIIEKNNIDIIYSHSTPLVDHLVALKLKRLFPALKWIAHFSDPWTLNPYIKYKNKFIKYINKKIEKKVLLESDIITLTSDRTKELFVKNFNFVKYKSYILPHVFDKKLYFKTNKKNKKIIITHAGNIYGLRTIKYLLEALYEIKNILYDRIEIRFYGKIKQEDMNLVTKYKLQNLVKVFNQVPYLESIKIISISDFLLLIDAPLNNSPFFPSKLADYIGTNKPIIALTPKNSTTFDILNNLSNNFFISPPDKKESIKVVFKKLLKFDNNISFKNVELYDMKNYDLLKEVFEK